MRWSGLEWVERRQLVQPQCSAQLACVAVVVCVSLFVGDGVRWSLNLSGVSFNADSNVDQLPTHDVYCACCSHTCVDGACKDT